VPGAGCRVPGAGCRVPGAGCRVPGAGCRVPDDRRQAAGGESEPAPRRHHDALRAPLLILPTLPRRRSPNQGLSVRSRTFDRRHARRSTAHHPASTGSCRICRAPCSGSPGFRPPPTRTLANSAQPTHCRIRGEWNTPQNEHPHSPRRDHSDNEIMRRRCTCSVATPRRIAFDPRHDADRPSNPCVPLSALRPPAPVHDVAPHRSRDDVRRPTGSSPASA
jgi:hypothetical protein